MSTPPGWYPDPGHTGHGPALERWWDGAAWSDYIREPQGAVASRVPPAHGGFGPPEPRLPRVSPAPPPPGYTPVPAAAPRRGTAVASAAVVLAAALVGGIALMNGGGDSSGKAGAQTNPGPSRSAPGTAGGSGGGATPSLRPTSPPEAAADVANGIGVPVLDGWDRRRGDPGGVAVTTGPYPCPSELDAGCVRGGVFTGTVLGSEAKSAESVAKEDIAHNAEDSYGKDPRSGRQMYGGIVAHGR